MRGERLVSSNPRVRVWRYLIRCRRKRSLLRVSTEQQLQEAHTVRIYRGDVTALLRYLDSSGRDDLAVLDLALLRGWLGAQQRGPLLVGPQPQPTLPAVLRPDQAAAALQAAQRGR